MKGKRSGKGIRLFARLVLAASVLAAWWSSPPRLVQANDYEWHATFGGSSSDEGRAIAFDAEGNAVIASLFSNSATLTSGGTELTVSGNSLRDIAVAKLDSAGIPQWMIAFGSAGSEDVSGIAVDSAGNSYVGGTFDGTINFPDISETRTSNSIDGIIVAISPAGEVRWVYSCGAEGKDRLKGIQIGSDGYLYATGNFIGSVDFDPGPGDMTLTSNAGSSDIFLLKMDTAGNLIWAQAFGGTATEVGQAVEVDLLGNIILAGYYSSSDLVIGGTALPTPNGTDMFLAKLAPGLTADWATSLGGTAGDYAYGLAVDSAGAISLAGLYQDQNGPKQILISHYSQDGTELWAQMFAGTTENSANGIVADDAGNLYVTGNFDGTIDFDPGPGQTTLNATSTDVFILKLSAQGVFQWVRQIGGSDSDVGYGLAVDPGGNLVATGYFNTTVDFDPGSGTSFESSNGYYDGFILRLQASIETCGITTGQSYIFGVGAAEPVGVVVEEAGGLSCLEVAYVSGDHPFAIGTGPGTGTMTGRWWQATPTITDATPFSLRITLPHDNLTNPELCRYLSASSTWDCAMNDYSTTWVTRSSMATLGDLAVGTDMPPTAVQVTSFRSIPAQLAGGPIPTITLSLLCLLLIFLQLRTKSRKKL